MQIIREVHNSNLKLDLQNKNADGIYIVITLNRYAINLLNCRRYNVTQSKTNRF